LTTGYVDCWGDNSSGQLGVYSTTSSSIPKQVFAVGSVSSSSLLSGVSSIAAGRNHTCVVLTTGYVDCWGSNGSGQLGDFTTTSRRTPVQVFAVGSVSSSSLLSGVSSISTGDRHTCVVLTDGGVDCWGYNGLGQLGVYSTTSSSTPKQVFAVGNTDGTSLLSGVSSISSGYDHNCVVLTGGGVDCWGSKGLLQL